jgi:hypothetical protein
MTHSIEILVAASQAIAAGVHMRPRSPNDKEHFPQDWFADRVSALALPYEPQGRNSYPDLWVGDQATPPVEGYEIKSLAFAKGNGKTKATKHRIARTDAGVVRSFDVFECR